MGRSHQKQIKPVTKATLDHSRQYAKMRDRISELKKEFKKYNHGRMGEMYKILKEIVNLKRALPENIFRGSRYTFRSLEWEKDLGLSAMQIRYIESYIFISDYGIKCVDKGLIDDTTICHFLAISTLLREEKWQNKLIDLVIANKIKISQVSELTKEELKLFLQGKLKRRMSDDYFFTATKTIRSLQTRINQRKHLLHDSNFSKNLFNAVQTLYFELKEQMDVD